MSFDLQGDTITANASADLSASQFRFTDWDGSGNVVIASAVGQLAFGVLEDKPTALGRGCRVRYRGTAPTVYGAAVTKGQEVISDASGRAIPAVSSSDFIMGRALMGGSLGDVGLVALQQGGRRSQGRIVTFTYDLVDITATTILNNLQLPFAGRIVGVRALVTRAGTGAAASITLTPSIGGVALTGGVLTLTLANTTPIGTVIASTAITAGNAFAANANIVLTASAITVFTAGRVELMLIID